MTITSTYRWNGKRGSDGTTDVPNRPGPDKTDWDPIGKPSFLSADGDHIGSCSDPRRGEWRSFRGNASDT